MSCILYPKGAYEQLEKNSQLARELFAPFYVANFLFELNADAYKVRYGHHDGIDDEIHEARADLDGDYEFALTNWNDPTELHRLLRRVDYQCSDIHDTNSPDPDHVARYEVLETAIAECEQRVRNIHYQAHVA